MAISIGSTSFQNTITKNERRSLDSFSTESKSPSFKSMKSNFQTSSLNEINFSNGDEGYSSDRETGTGDSGIPKSN